ncbi:MAG: dihydrolipoyl dehydrogenase, partial [Deltaproteobacteria bacterium]|nr:dihydrolipoyl dehydrogenase [Deltaproteobacteria bacterium]
MDNSKLYDLFVVGGGPAGYAAAIYAAKNGLSVGLCDRDRLGGTCLNRGCIPTKTYCASAELIIKMREARSFGIKADNLNAGIDFDALFERKESVVNRQVEGLKQLIRGNKIDYYEGEALIESDKRVIILRSNSEGRTEIGFKNLIIATGSEPSGVKGIEIDHKYILDSTDILSLRKLPESILILGGGVIGTEFAMIMSVFGVKVYLAEILKRIIATEDTMASRIVHNTLKTLGVEINTDVSVEDLRIAEDKVSITLSNKKDYIVEKVLVAAGRKPVVNISEKLKNTLLGEKGFISTDEFLRTGISNIYAAGDVTGGMMLAHKAHYDAEVAVDNILGKNRRADYSAVPSVIYTHPEVASSGLSEERAKEKGIEVKIGRFFVASNGMAMAKNAKDGFVKIVSEKESGKIIGGTIVSESASEMVTALTLAIKEKMTFEDIHDLIW